MGSSMALAPGFIVTAMLGGKCGSNSSRSPAMAGPNRFRLDELIREFLIASQDTRQVATDVNARYFGAKLDEESLVPRGDSRIGDWLTAVATAAV